MPRRRSYRKQAEDISAGKEPPRYLGPLTSEVAQAMVWSILNTKQAFRTKVWGKNWKKLLNMYASNL